MRSRRIGGWLQVGRIGEKDRCRKVQEVRDGTKFRGGADLRHEEVDLHHEEADLHLEEEEETTVEAEAHPDIITKTHAATEEGTLVHHREKTETAIIAIDLALAHHLITVAIAVTDLLSIF